MKRRIFEYTCEWCGNKASVHEAAHSPKGWGVVKLPEEMRMMESDPSVTTTVNLEHDLCEQCLEPLVQSRPKRDR